MKVLLGTCAGAWLTVALVAFGASFPVLGLVFLAFGAAHLVGAVTWPPR